MTLTNLTSLLRQKLLLEEIIRLLDKLEVSANFSIVDSNDLDTINKIMMAWNRKTWEEVLVEDAIVGSYHE